MKVFELFGEIKIDAQGANRTLDSVGKKFTSAGKAMTLGVTTPLLGIGALMVKVASDAEETASKFDAVFKEQSESVRSWAEETASSMNRSSIEWEGYLGTLQDTFVPLGFARDQAAELSKNMVVLAEDLASFNNLNTADVVRDLQSALVGNTETLRKYGVVASQAAIEEYALSNGLITSKDQLDANIKAQAIYAMTVEATTDAQGDALRTSDSFANQMKGLQAQFMTLGVELGEELLPILTRLIESIIPIIQRFANMDDGTQQLILTMAAVVAAAGPVALAIGAIASPVGLVVAAIGLLIAAGVHLYQNWDEIKPKIIAVWNGIKDKALEVFNGITTFFTNIFVAWPNAMRDAAVNMVLGFINGINSQIQAAKDTVQGFAGNVLGWFRGVLGIESPSKEFDKAGRASVQGFVDGWQATAKNAEAVVKLTAEQLLRIQEAAWRKQDEQVKALQARRDENLRMAAETQAELERLATEKARNDERRWRVELEQIDALKARRAENLRFAAETQAELERLANEKAKNDERRWQAQVDQQDALAARRAENLAMAAEVQEELERLEAEAFSAKETRWNLQVDMERALQEARAGNLAMAAEVQEELDRLAEVKAEGDEARWVQQVEQHNALQERRDENLALAAEVQEELDRLAVEALAAEEARWAEQVAMADALKARRQENLALAEETQDEIARLEAQALLEKEERWRAEVQLWDGLKERRSENLKLAEETQAEIDKIEADALEEKEARYRREVTMADGLEARRLENLALAAEVQDEIDRLEAERVAKQEALRDNVLSVTSAIMGGIAQIGDAIGGKLGNAISTVATVAQDAMSIVQAFTKDVVSGIMAVIAVAVKWITDFFNRAAKRRAEAIAKLRKEQEEAIDIIGNLYDEAFDRQDRLMLELENAEQRAFDQLESLYRQGLLSFEEYQAEKLRIAEEYEAARLALELKKLNQERHAREQEAQRVHNEAVSGLDPDSPLVQQAWRAYYAALAEIEADYLADREALELDSQDRIFDARRDLLDGQLAAEQKSFDDTRRDDERAFQQEMRDAEKQFNDAERELDAQHQGVMNDIRSAGNTAISEEQRRINRQLQLEFADSPEARRKLEERWAEEDAIAIRRAELEEATLKPLKDAMQAELDEAQRAFDEARFAREAAFAKEQEHKAEVFAFKQEQRREAFELYLVEKKAALEEKLALEAQGALSDSETARLAQLEAILNGTFTPPTAGMPPGPPPKPLPPGVSARGVLTTGSTAIPSVSSGGAMGNFAADLRATSENFHNAVMSKIAADQSHIMLQRSAMDRLYESVAQVDIWARHAK